MCVFHQKVLNASRIHGRIIAIWLFMFEEYFKLCGCVVILKLVSRRWRLIKTRIETSRHATRLRFFFLHINC